MVEMRTQLAIERAGLVTLHLQPARRSSIPTNDLGQNVLAPVIKQKVVRSSVAIDSARGGQR